MTTTYVDASRHNGAIDWPKVAHRVILKAGGSDAGRYADAAFGANLIAASTHGKLAGAYWFNGTGDAGQDAAFFLARTGALPASALHVLDIEDMIGQPGTAWSPGKALVFFKAVRQAKPSARLVAYMNVSVENGHDWSALVAMGVELWLAHYGHDDGTIAGSGTFTLKHWKRPLLVQYTDRGSAGGFGGAVDLSYSDADIFAAAQAPATHPAAASVSAPSIEEDVVVDITGTGTYTPAKPFEPSLTAWQEWRINPKGDVSFVANFDGLVDVDVATRIAGLPVGETIQARFALVTYEGGKQTKVAYSDVVELHGSAGEAFPAFSDKIVLAANQRLRLMFLSQHAGATVKRVGLSVARFKLASA